MGRLSRGNRTPQDLLLPEGKLIRTTRGGPTSLKQLLLDLKKYSFSGYVRTVRSVGGTRSEGVILLRGGNPEASLHQFGDIQDRGRGALKKVWQDSYDGTCTIELHARVDMDAITKEYADAVLERPAKVVKRAKIPQTIDRGEIEEKIRTWKGRGYDVSSVEGILEGDPNVLTAAYLALLEAVRKAEAVEDTLLDLDATGFEARAAALREKVRDPIHHPDIDAEVESLRDAIESHRQGEARRQLERVRERDSQERTKKVVELVLKQRALAPETKPQSQEEVTKVFEEPAPKREEETNLIPAYTLDGFVIGESNRFAHGAAAAVAKAPAGAYNPLIIVSGPGLGKSHLLHGIGNGIRSRSATARVLYLSCDAFTRPVRDGEGRESLEAFRDRLSKVDCLLLDDLQVVTGRADAQEELLRTIAALSDDEKQVVLASDRAPKAIANLDERLVSRLETGLLAAIRAPERETRIAILERRAKDANLRVEAGVLEYIADLVDDNVRELQGAFSRVISFSSLMGRPITTELAKEVLRDVLGQPAREEKPPAPSVPSELKPGRSYLVEEDRPEEAYRLLSKALSGKKGGLLITRTNPKRVRERFALQADRTLWLTDRDSASEETIAPALERIVYEIERFLAEHPRGAVLLDGIEYLVSNNSFDAVLRFIRRLVDTVSEGHYILLISLGPATLKDQELKMLEREMDVIRVTS